MDQHNAPLPVSSFLLLEFRQTCRLQVRLHHNDRSRGFGQREATAMMQVEYWPLGAIGVGWWF